MLSVAFDPAMSTSCDIHILPGSVLPFGDALSIVTWIF